MPKHGSLWEETTDRRSHPSLTGDAETDVVIIGAGVTGLTAAVLLERAGERVIVLEKDRVGGGTTGLTTAHVSTLWDHGYHDVGKKYGREVAAQVARGLLSGLMTIESLVSELSIECSFERLPGYHYAEVKQSAAQIRKEFEAARDLGLPVSWIEELPLPLPIQAGFVIDGQAQLHALDYLQGLAANVKEGCIYERTPVTGISDSPCEVRTAQGNVRARRVIVATHTPLGLSPLHMELSPHRSFVLAARVRDELPRALFWDTEERTTIFADISAATTSG